MQSVAIFGVGLIGGSFGLALKKAGFNGRIVGVSSPSTIAAAQAAGAIDQALPEQDAARIADLIYLSQPISRIVDTLPRLNDWVRPDALVTDAGSTKSLIVNRAAGTLSRCQFLGGHPLAGKERRGVEHGDPDLFRDKTYVLTPRRQEDLQTPAATAFVEWLRRIGANPHITTSERHDEVVAYASHLPQVMSTALGVSLSRKFAGELPPFWGPALVDSTRLALSPFEIWGDILETNRSEISAALTGYIRHLQEIRDHLGLRELETEFEEAARLARQVRVSG